MLCTSAFNALLKTLEEPPAHVKFIFATTEIRKVPVTVLSRCQRFDLRRIEPEAMMAHLARIAAAEGVEVGAGRAGADRPRRRGLGARRAVAARPGDRPRRRRRPPRPRCAPCWASPTAGRVLDLFELIMAGDAARRAGRARRAVRRRRRSDGGAARPRRGHALGLDGAARARGGRRPDASAPTSARAASTSPGGCRCGCWRGPGRCCSRRWRRSATAPNADDGGRDGGDPADPRRRPADPRGAGPPARRAAAGAAAGPGRGGGARAAQRPARRPRRPGAARRGARRRRRRPERRRRSPASRASRTWWR